MWRRDRCEPDDDRGTPNTKFDIGDLQFRSPAARTTSNPRVHFQSRQVGAANAAHSRSSTDRPQGAIVHPFTPPRVLRIVRSAATICGILLTFVAIATARSYKTGVFGDEVKVRAGAFTIFAWRMDEKCNPLRDGAAFSISPHGGRGGLPPISGKVSPSGKLTATGHDGRGVQTVRGRIHNTRMTITVTDTGPLSTGPGSPICHGAQTEHLALGGTTK